MILHAITLAFCTLIYTICIHVFYCVLLLYVRVKIKNKKTKLFIILFTIYHINNNNNNNIFISTQLLSLLLFFPFLLFYHYFSVIYLFSRYCILLYIYYIHIIFTLYTPLTPYILTCRYIYPSPYSTRSSLRQSAKISVFPTIRIYQPPILLTHRLIYISLLYSTALYY